MAAVLNRTTGAAAPYAKDYRTSVNTPDYPTGQWIHDPDLTAVAGFESIYWIITGDTVTLADQATRDARDAEIQTNVTLASRGDAVGIPDDPATVGMQQRALIEVFNQRDNYLVNRIAELQAALDAAKASSGAAQNIRDAIPATWLATNTRPRPDAVQAYKDEINAGNVDT